jgi:hypothetical protein
MSSVNQYSFSVRRVSFVVAYWTRTRGDPGSNPGSVGIFFLSCSRHVVILDYPKNYFSKILYFLKIFYQTSLFVPVASGASVDPTSQVCSSVVLVLPIVGN